MRSDRRQRPDCDGCWCRAPGRERRSSGDGAPRCRIRWGTHELGKWPLVDSVVGPTGCRRSSRCSSVLWPGSRPSEKDARSGLPSASGSPDCSSVSATSLAPTWLTRVAEAGGTLRRRSVTQRRARGGVTSLSSSTSSYTPSSERFRQASPRSSTDVGACSAGGHPKLSEASPKPTLEQIDTFSDSHAHGHFRAIIVLLGKRSRPARYGT